MKIEEWQYIKKLLEKEHLQTTVKKEMELIVNIKSIIKEEIWLLKEKGEN